MRVFPSQQDTAPTKQHDTQRGRRTSAKRLRNENDGMRRKIKRANKNPAARNKTQPAQHKDELSLRCTVPVRREKCAKESRHFLRE